jgi:lipopolysaccharide/colanic/teichoic acid biosynthesis glycosyltransferase
VFFRQVRVGLHGKPFRILKFRTMVADAEAKGPMVTAAQDSRITPLGAWLRKTKLDELPQLVNVLLGEMSLVGPRPEVPGYVAFYSDEQRRIFTSMKPGITDYAAIVFRNESEELNGVDDPVEYYRTRILPRKFELYQRYHREQSVWVDLRILVMTILAILGRDQELPAPHRP